MSVKIKFKVNLPATAPHGGCINEDMRGVDGQVITCRQYYSTYYDFEDVKTGWVYHKDWLLPVEDERPTYPNPPHRHAELIKAWADGAEIQWFDPDDELWCAPFSQNPAWSLDRVYRIKPTIDNTKEISSIRVEMEKLAERLKDLEN